MTRGIVNFGPAGRPAGPSARRTVRIHLVLALSAFASLCLVFFPLFSANGYVLTGRHLLLLMTENLGRGANVRVHQTTFLYDGAVSDDGVAPEVRTQLTEILTYRFSRAFRSDSTSTDFMRIHIDTLDAAATVLDGRLAIQTENRYDRYKDLLLFHSRTLLQERLLGRGIDPAVSSLGRFEGDPVYVLGAQYPDLSTAQVWIEKETFHPIRLLYPMTNGEGDVSILEFRYMEWQLTGKLWYPMRIECYEGNDLIRVTLAEDVDVEPAIDEDAFDIGRLNFLYGEESYVEQDLGATDEQSDIQKAIEDFNKRYE